MKQIIYLLGILATMATVLPLIRSESAWIRIFDFPRIQIAALALFVLTAHVFLSDNGLYKYALVLALLACISFQAYMIYPYTLLSVRQVLDAESNDPSRKFSLLISNVFMKNRDVRSYLQVIKDSDPDIILVAEPDKWWEEQLRSLESSHGYTIKCPLDNTYGMLLYSRLRLINPEIKFLVEGDVPSMHSLVEMRSGDLLELHFLHPKPPHPAKNPDTKERDVELLLVGREVKGTSRPVI
ncbi:MAG: endonuclease/exonuclease/phosphatase family protein, partial [Syntrophobacteraceae bacterium]